MGNSRNEKFSSEREKKKKKKHFSLRRIEKASRRKNEVLEIENGNSGFSLTESENLYIID